MRLELGGELDEKWEVDFPKYRVYFWHNPIAHPIMWTSYVYDVSDAHNVHQVLAWAEANARGRRYQVFALVDDRARGVGLLALAGSNPTRPADPRAEPTDELQAAAELEHVGDLEASRRRGEERVRAWILRDDEERRTSDA